MTPGRLGWGIVASHCHFKGDPLVIARSVSWGSVYSYIKEEERNALAVH